MAESVATGVAIIGAGIAGASLAHFLAPHLPVVVLEAESQPGYHATGRSAALFDPCYGTDQVRALTRASRAFLESPPAGVAPASVLSPRGVLYLQFAGQAQALDRIHAAVSPFAPHLQRIGAAEAASLVPVLRPGMVQGALHEPDARDIDVHALHQGYLRSARASGARLHLDAAVRSIERRAGGWRLACDRLTVDAEVIVNAAGAWADMVAGLAGVAPLGLVPKRRSAFTFAAPDGVDCRDWPLFIAADESFYVKPDAGVLLGSPANADPTVPHDVRPEELDIATGIHRIEEATTLTIRRPIATWAGLRSFVADGDLVGGFDPVHDSFFWLCAQGGYGIQTSAAMGESCARLLLGQPLPSHVADQGLTVQRLSPARLR